jgi:hypothetical protein
MTAIANALVKAIKKELGIKSPSKVMMGIGTNTAQGYINGYTSLMNRQRASMAKASLFTPQSAYGGATGPANDQGPWANTGSSKQITQHITVNTQEIDPRKHSAELGWELAGRV